MGQKKDRWSENITESEDRSKKIRKKIQEKGIYDLYRETKIENEEEEYSFFRRDNEEKIIYKSRIDHCLGSLEVLENIKLIGYEQPDELSPDHCKLIIKMKIEKNIKNNKKSKKNNEKEIKNTIVEEIDIKNVTIENKKVLIDRVIEYKEMKEAQENRKVKIEKLQNVIKRIYKDAGEIIGIKKRN